MSDQSRATVRATHHYATTAERVFDAWLDPRKAGKFLFATETGQMIRAEIDPRVAGRFVLTDRRPDMGDVEHVGEYIDIDRPRHLRFKFAVPAYSELWTTVSIDIAPSISGCDLTLTHEDALEEYREKTAEGWISILASLAKALS